MLTGATAPPTKLGGKMGLVKCKHCRGMVIESDIYFNPYTKMTEFECINCGRSFEFSTQKYIGIMKALNIDYTGRLR